MHKIDAPGATETNTFTEGDPNVPTAPTTVGAKWLNAVQGELVALVEGLGGTLTGFLTLHANPTNALHAAPKQYVDSAVAGVDLSGKVSKTGDTMMGFLTLHANPSSNLHSSTKQYVDTADALKAPLASPALTGAPTAPTAAVATDNTQIATTAHAKLTAPGWGQTWQDVSGSRAAATLYTNSTGKPIFVAITIGNVSSDVRVDTGAGLVNVGGVVAGGTAQHNTITFMVPAGASYRLHSAVAFIYWSELR